MSNAVNLKKEIKYHKKVCTLGLSILTKAKCDTMKWKQTQRLNPDVHEESCLSYIRITVLDGNVHSFAFFSLQIL